VIWRSCRWSTTDSALGFATTAIVGAASPADFGCELFGAVAGELLPEDVFFFSLFLFLFGIRILHIAIRRQRHWIQPRDSTRPHGRRLPQGATRRSARPIVAMLVDQQRHTWPTFAGVSPGFLLVRRLDVAEQLVFGTAGTPAAARCQMMKVVGIPAMVRRFVGALSGQLRTSRTTPTNWQCFTRLIE